MKGWIVWLGAVLGGDRALLLGFGMAVGALLFILSGGWFGVLG